MTTPYAFFSRRETASGSWREMSSVRSMRAGSPQKPKIPSTRRAISRLIRLSTTPPGDTAPPSSPPWPASMIHRTPEASRIAAAVDARPSQRPARPPRTAPRTRMPAAIHSALLFIRPHLPLQTMARSGGI